jgi:hypothetical protein
MKLNHDGVDPQHPLYPHVAIEIELVSAMSRVAM